MKRGNMTDTTIREARQQRKINWNRYVYYKFRRFASAYQTHFKWKIVTEFAFYGTCFENVYTQPQIVQHFSLLYFLSTSRTSTVFVCGCLRHGNGPLGPVTVCCAFTHYADAETRHIWIMITRHWISLNWRELDVERAKCVVCATPARQITCNRLPLILSTFSGLVSLSLVWLLYSVEFRMRITRRTANTTDCYFTLFTLTLVWLMYHLFYLWNRWLFLSFNRIQFGLKQEEKWLTKF